MPNPTTPARRGNQGASTKIDLVLLDPNIDGRFLLEAKDGGFQCPSIRLARGASTAVPLADAIERAMSDQLHISAEYVGLASFNASAASYELMAYAELKTSVKSANNSSLRSFALSEMKATGVEAARVSHFEAAQHRRAVEKSAVTMGPRISSAFEQAVNRLDARRTTEDDLKGWSQFLDGNKVGVLSTAQAVLSYVHAGKRTVGMEEGLRTLEELQNPDGGWQVRRALIGSSSTLSITESTCFCAWALLVAGKSLAEKTLKKGIAWLEFNQNDEGGWSSSAETDEAQTYATALAVRVLVLSGSSQAVLKGMGWLRKAQHDDGGWGPTANTRDSTHPAYTAHCLISLLLAGAPPDDPDIRRGCAYLEQAMDRDAAEPWPATSINTLVDKNTGARLDFRHFTTPWALSALSLSGRDLGDAAVLAATGRLLGLQMPDGTWRSSLAASNVSPVWATHDALFALRTLVTASNRDVGSAALAKVSMQEKALMQDALSRMLQASPPLEPAHNTRRTLQYSWLSLISIVLLIVVAVQFNLIAALSDPSLIKRLASTALAAVVAFVGVAAPAVLAQEYRFRRDRSERKREGESS